ncbi:hypothetical protein Poli38472_004792 [Pythium oligandrum]|uniref:BZIP domain-containing protein n=1 Tax=Pythium oligandrum TaxID=41045 RepID=A0A8K1CBQ1_PYTOL|nr:hypothetical protein Poli38472_004792 [Pythium oligandrum]|eukprot:TMW59723.1 hypothetical protein Poli38472_004792 [Pythium oligandrum]
MEPLRVASDEDVFAKFPRTMQASVESPVHEPSMQTYYGYQSLLETTSMPYTNPEYIPFPETRFMRYDGYEAPRSLRTAEDLRHRSLEPPTPSVSAGTDTDSEHNNDDDVDVSKLSKSELRKHKNRQSAARSRKRSRERMDMLEHLVRELSAKNRRLEQEVRALSLSQQSQHPFYH